MDDAGQRMEKGLSQRASSVTLRIEMRKIMEQKKVLMTASVPSMIGQFNMENIRILKELGYEVHVACNFSDRSVWTGETTAQFQKQMYEHKVACQQVAFSRSPLTLRQHIRSYQSLCRSIKREHYAFVHCHTPIAGAITRLACDRTNTKVVYTAHGFHFYRHAPLWNWLTYYPAEKWLSRVTDVLVTMNQEDYGRARRQLRAKKTVYIPGVGIDTGRFQSMGAGKQPHSIHPPDEKKQETALYEKRKQLGISKEDFVLLSVGELSRRKNHRLVLETLSRIKGTQIRYVICGIGKEEQALRREAAKRGLDGRVIFAGYRTDVKEFYGMADLFVFPSLQEGLPVALMEAMAMGLPCLASDIRGNRDLLEHEKDTCLFSLDHPEMFRKKLEALMGNPLLRERVSRQNREEIRRFDKKRVNRRMRQIYEGMGEMAQR